MKKLTLDEVKKIQLEILAYIDSFCKKNNISYFINYGTLLGAVRHKGFIPWDDDIDISMDREYYNMFIEKFNQDSSKYKILSLDTDKAYFNNFIKVVDTTTKIVDNRNYKTFSCGVFVDIFPMDKFNDKKIITIAKKLFNLVFYKKTILTQSGYNKLIESKINNNEIKTLIKCSLKTGRTHQIRVHMAYIKHPIYGDPIYNKYVDEFGQRLHAKEISFVDMQGKMQHFEIDFPKEFKEEMSKIA